LWNYIDSGNLNTSEKKVIQRNLSTTNSTQIGIKKLLSVLKTIRQHSTSFGTKLDLCCFFGEKCTTSDHKLKELCLNLYGIRKDGSRKKEKEVLELYRSIR
jgi:hypothetical protein